MKRSLILLSLMYLFLGACRQGIKKQPQNPSYLSAHVPDKEPLDVAPLHIPPEMLVHRGLYSPDLSHFYYTLSPPDFSQFDIYVMEKEGKTWSHGRKATFNSAYSDHGMSFSPDGKSLYFSSTRPLDEEGIANTWHIWKTELSGGSWSKPSYVDIPNMRDKLLSHPTIGNSGRLYFHASNLDYSEMNLYYADIQEGKYLAAVKLDIPGLGDLDACTPYVSPDEDFLIFAAISHQLDLMITFNGTEGRWTRARTLSDKINTNGQGNPYLSPDHKFLFYAAEGDPASNWSIKWVNIESELKKD